ncbi:MAG: glycosyltransferase family 39 protein [Elusimicrobiota bacterium]|nr:glycosyltransferase family 39 protein [Elusimicrobiota bacterium]
MVAAFVLATGLCLWAKPWHMDEPFFLAIARQILKDPGRPLSFSFNWYGSAVPMGTINNTPPLLAYLLAAALKLAGGSEFWTRALFFPFDLAAAWGLLALAARFLKKPLWPTLIVLAGPAWALNMHHLMAERVMAGFALPCLWLLVKGVDERSARAWRASAALACLAILSKYNAVFLLPAAVAYGVAAGAPYPALAAWCLAAVSGAAAWQLWSWASGANPGLAALAVTAEASAGFWSAPSHKARALLAFTGGCGLAAASWGALLRPPRALVAAAAVLSAVLFAPWLDLAPVVRGVDRATGFILAWGVLVSAGVLAAGRRTRGAPLWAAWALSVAALQLAYWSVLARFVVFLVPPLTFWLAERLEERGASWRPHAAVFAATAALGLGVGVVDWTYAAAQREAARRVAAEGAGARLWTTAHWGLQEYLVAAGGRPLDLAAGGWDAVRPGDLVVVTRANSNAFKPPRPIAASVSSWRVESPVPLRHLSAWTGEGAFYSSVMGFLPWSFSTEPVEEFTVVSPR